MKANPLVELEKLGQSIWLDFIRRGMISSGELRRLIEEDGVTGVTSNPSIFEKAIAESRDYDAAIRTLAQSGKSVEDIYQDLTISDIQLAADLFRPAYDRSNGADGFVSLEVSPLLAHDTAGTIDEARHLWKTLSRPNVMIKVPGTTEGIPAVRQLISEGININVTLLFGIPRYQEIVESFITGLEDRKIKGLPLDRVASVASFFLSRIDVLLDPLLEKEMREENQKARTAAHLKGQIAIASAKVAYQFATEIFSSERFQKLAESGARTQRLLWASTSTKNPEYSDVKYVEPLIGKDTVNTLPLETVNAYRDHGNPHMTLSSGVDEARSHLDQLRMLGLHLDALTQQLENEGVRKFDDAFRALMSALRQKSEAGATRPSREQVRSAASVDRTAQNRNKS
jgi:transaldolase